VNRYFPQLEDMELPTSLHEMLRPLLVTWSSTMSEPVVGTVFSAVMVTKFMLLSVMKNEE
jgi:hypothetical protein